MWHVTAAWGLIKRQNHTDNSTVCEFGPALSEMLRDWLVCGIGDAQIQKRVLAEPKLTMDKASELAFAQELAKPNAAQL